MRNNDVFSSSSTTPTTLFHASASWGFMGGWEADSSPYSRWLVSELDPFHRIPEANRTEQCTIGHVIDIRPSHWPEERQLAWRDTTLTRETRVRGFWWEHRLFSLVRTRHHRLVQFAACPSETSGMKAESMGALEFPQLHLLHPS